MSGYILGPLENSADRFFHTFLCLCFYDAEKLFKEVLEIQLRTLGRDHPDLTLSLYDFADLYHLEKRYPEAISLIRQDLEIQRRVLGSHHPETLDSLYSLACVLSLNGERESAFRTLKELDDAGFSDAHTLATDDELAGGAHLQCPQPSMVS